MEGFFARLKKPALDLPHPEEAMNPLATVESMHLTAILDKWFLDWGVPEADRVFWRSWPIVLVPGLKYNGAEYPALTWPDRIDLDPRWANPGVIAHECCHVLWARFDAAKRTAFSAQYQSLMLTDDLLQLMRSRQPYVQSQFGKNSDIEGHAECYRYLGTRMPAGLLVFYEGLIDKLLRDSGRTSA
jgi:hypothetical protein